MSKLNSFGLLFTCRDAALKTGKFLQSALIEPAFKFCRNRAEAQMKRT
jgi:hypothetical protein